MAGMADYLPMLIKMLAGVASPASIPGMVMGGGAATPAAAAPAPGPMQGPPMPPPPPQAVLPPSGPIPEPNPMGVFPPAPMAAQAPAASGGPLAQMLGLGPNFSHFLRQAGAGMANIKGNPYGDPFIDAAQGFGGAQAYASDQDAAKAKASVAAGDTAYDRSKDTAEMELKRLAEARQQKSADLSDQKTALEIRRDARQNGVTVTQMLDIERIAQAAGENLFGDKRKQAIDDERQRLLDQVTSGQGLTGKAGGLSSGDGQTATGPNGEKVVLRNGQWEPVQ